MKSSIVSKEEFRKKRYFLPEMFVLAVVMGISVAAHSGDAVWQTLNQQVTQLSVSGRNQEALPVAEKAADLYRRSLVISEPIVGPKNPGLLVTVP